MLGIVLLLVLLVALVVGLYYYFYVPQEFESLMYLSSGIKDTSADTKIKNYNISCVGFDLSIPPVEIPDAVFTCAANLFGITSGCSVQLKINEMSSLAKAMELQKTCDNLIIAQIINADGKKDSIACMTKESNVSDEKLRKIADCFYYYSKDPSIVLLLTVGKSLMTPEGFIEVTMRAGKNTSLKKSTTIFPGQKIIIAGIPETLDSLKDMCA